MKRKRATLHRLIIISLVFILPIFLFAFFQLKSRAEDVKANIVIDLSQKGEALPPRWLALAQGGEEMGVQMLENVVPQIAALYPRYIRLDHIYDYYHVIKRSGDGALSYDWASLDQTVCDIYHTGAKPFFVLGYMSPEISKDGSLVSVPTDWGEWKLTVKKTVEHYSGASTRLCGQVSGDWMKDIYYEVWNEPDLETFGKWSIYGGEKDYKQLYRISIAGALEAANVNHFFIGGPANTAAYKNWIQGFLRFVSNENLRVDFLSWHHYSKSTDDFTTDMANLSSWLSEPEFQKYQTLQRIVTEWGFDSDPNLIADTNAGAAHTVASIRTFLKHNFDLAFLFDIKDGPAPRWGILTHDGEKKPRYNALKLLALLEGSKLNVTGEGTHVKAIATNSPTKSTVVLVNYDQDNKNTESVPVTFHSISNGTYTITLTYLDGTTSTIPGAVAENEMLQRSILLPPNMVVALELKKDQ